MKKLFKDQRGVTLLEIIIVAGITGLIAAGITTTIAQIFTGSTRSSSHMAVVREVQEAGYWVGFYVYTAQNTEITGISGFPLTLRWIDFETSGPNARQKVVFSLNNSGLRGKHYVGDSTTPDPAKTGKIPVFELVDPDRTNLKFGGGSDFSLPDIGDAFTITGGGIPDNGRIFFPGGQPSSDPITTGNATLGAWDSSSKSYPWTAGAGGTITVRATSSGTKGRWTSETKAAIAAITADSDKDATLSNGRVLILTVTARMGKGQQEVSESRVYEIVPKPVS